MDLGILVDFVQGEKGLVAQIASLLLAGAVAGPCVILIARLLALPVVREPVGAVLLGLGKGASLFMTRYLGTWGGKLEDAIQEFCVFCVNKIFAGLDHDDKGRKVRVVIERH